MNEDNELPWTFYLLMIVPLGLYGTMFLQADLSFLGIYITPLQSVELLIIAILLMLSVASFVLERVSP